MDMKFQKGDIVTYYGSAYMVLQVFKNSDIILIKKCTERGERGAEVYVWGWKCRKAK